MSDGFAKQVGRRIRQMRKARRITQDQMGQMIGLDATNLSRLERGQTNLPINRLPAIARALGLPDVTALVTDNESFAPPVDGHRQIAGVLYLHG